MEWQEKIEINPANEGWWLARHENEKHVTIVTAFYLSYARDVTKPTVFIHGPISCVQTEYFIEGMETIFEEFAILPTDQEYAELLEASTMLGALEAAGVDNWDGYDDAMELTK